MQEVRAIYDAAMKKTSEDKVAAQKRLEAMDANRRYATKTYTLATVTNDQNDIDLCIDMLGRSPIYEAIVEQEIARNEEIAKDIKDLTPHIDQTL